MGVGRGVLAVCTALPLLAMTCQPQQGFLVRNRTGAPVTVQIQGDADDYDRLEIVTGGVLDLIVPVGGCEGSGIVAWDGDGMEIARLEQPVCDGQLWTVGPDGSASLED